MRSDPHDGPDRGTPYTGTQRPGKISRPRETAMGPHHGRTSEKTTRPLPHLSYGYPARTPTQTRGITFMNRTNLMILESPVHGKRARRVWRGPVRKRSSNATFAGWLPYGEAYAIIAGVRQKVQLFIMRLCFSRRTFAMAFPTQRQECFFYGHVKAFEYFGGVPQRISYDNLGPPFKIVFERSGRAGRSRKEVQAFARRNFLVPIPETASFDPSRLSSRPRG